jgi:hypothetical protein
MPFRSEAQRRALYAKDPKVAKEFEKHTPKGKKLPERIRPKKKK